MPKEVIYFIIIGGLVVILIICLILFKRIEKYRKIKYHELINESERYFRDLNLLDFKYLEYIEKHGATIDFTLKSRGDKDYLSQVEVKKYYQFFLDKILYVFNNQLRTKPLIKEIDNKQYFIIDGNIKTIDILASFEGKTHLLVKYDVKKNEQGFYLQINESKSSLLQDEIINRYDVL